MISRYAFAPLRGLALAGLAVAGFVVGVLTIVAATLVVTYPAAVATTRGLANLGRRLAGAWSGVEIPEPYRPGPPPAPPRRADGWYQHDKQLYKSPRMPAFLLKLTFLQDDPATGRDWWWLLLTPFTGGAVALLPAVLVVAGLASGTVLGVAAALAGVAAGPLAVSVHARWSRLLLAPAGGSWWRASGARVWVLGSAGAVWHCAALAGLSAAGAAVAGLQLVAAVFTGGIGFPFVALGGRWLTGWYRRFAAEWAGVEIAEPYRPEPPPPRPGPDGLYRYGRSLYTNPRTVARYERVGWVFGDLATWRDLVWMLTAPVVALPLLVLAALFGLGFFGLIWQPLWWPLWGVPLALQGTWVTPWYVWLGVVAVVPPLHVVPAPLSPLVGIVLALAAMVVAPPLRGLHVRWSRLLLAPTGAARLAQRVRRLTESRADAVDTQAAELRRIERDLHDGAQARLVAVGLSLNAIEELMDRDPQAAKALLAQARGTSSAALAELRDLVRGIHPPVLAERGLGDAVRAVALDSPLPVQVAVDLPVRPPAPVESAAYFAVCEALANAARHARATRVDVDIRQVSGVLRIAVTDDGRGGADPARGTGLTGMARRLGTFDGSLAVHSPPGGPTVLTIEIPAQPR